MIFKTEDNSFINLLFYRTYWYKNGVKHRDDGPACIYTNGTKSWFQNGKLHREDGPALMYADGRKYWYLNGEYLRSWYKA